MDKFWKNFKSGTDIRGVAVEGVEGEPLNLTDEVAGKMAKAFLLWLSKKTGRQAKELKVANMLQSMFSVACLLSHLNIKR